MNNLTSNYITTVKAMWLKCTFKFLSYSELYIDNIPCDAFLIKLHKEHWEAKPEAQISQISVKKLQQHSDRIQSTSLNACKCAWLSAQLFGEVPISCQTTAEIDAWTASRMQVRETQCRATGIVWDSPCPVYPELDWICVCKVTHKHLLAVIFPYWEISAEIADLSHAYDSPCQICSQGRDLHM